MHAVEGIMDSAIAMRDLLSINEITAWDEVFRRFEDLPAPDLVRVRFSVDRHEYGSREYAVALPRRSLQVPAESALIGRYLATFLYARLVTDGGNSVTLRAEPPEEEERLLEFLTQALHSLMPRASFYCNFGKPIVIQPEPERGRTPAQKTLIYNGIRHQRPGLILGLDIGGTRIKVVFVENGVRCREVSFEVTREGGAQLVKQVEDLIAAELALVQSERGVRPYLEGIAIAIAAVVKGQSVIRMTNFERWWAKASGLEVPQEALGPPLFGEDYRVINELPQRLRSRFGVGRVAFINDANAFGLQEASSCPEAGDATMIVMTLGTGIGYVKVTGAQIEELTHQGGHMVVSLGGVAGEPPVDPGCGHHGCIAAFASATALDRRLRERLDQRRVSTKLIDDCLQILKEAAHWLAIATAEFAVIVPELQRLVLGGCVVQGATGEYLIREVRAALQERFPELAGRMQVRLSQTDVEWGGAMGAAQYISSLAAFEPSQATDMTMPASAHV
jgi:predicted NBD/HSP70 family sugar kinase